MTDARATLPAVHQLLDALEREAAAAGFPRPLLVDAVRETLAAARRAGGAMPPGGWTAATLRLARDKQRRVMRRVVNATGVVLHTNLGRAPLARAAREAMQTAAGYTTLEYDLASGERGGRQAWVRDLLIELTGAEDAIVLTNAAAATIAILNSVSAGGETLVSRGELVEIGGGFRLPAILEKSGAILAEVGTTNRTRLSDYIAAVSPRTRCALKVHRSNFRLTGFTAEVTVPALVDAMTPRDVPVVHDAGSGLLLDLSEAGLDGEPLVQTSVAAGATVVFSGDKLVGGPQAGVVVGRHAVVEAVRANPFARAMRPGKTTLAALEATLALYRDPAAARREIPTLAMLTADPTALHERALTLAGRLPGARVEPGHSTVGGGAFPDADLPTTVVVLPHPHPDRLLAAMRDADTPVVARAAETGVVMDVRTVGDDELDAVVAAVHHDSATPT